MKKKPTFNKEMAQLLQAIEKNNKMLEALSPPKTNHFWESSANLTATVGGLSTYILGGGKPKKQPKQPKPPKPGSPKWIEAELLGRHIRKSKWRYKKSMAERLLIEVLKKWNDADESRDY